MDTSIKNINAYEILDSRGIPTIKVQVFLDDGSLGDFSVPSGASRGVYEAVELRDGDLARYNGKGVLTAVENVKVKIAPKLLGTDATKQREIDNVLLRLDGTKNKSKLGANSLLGVSCAVCKAAANSHNRKLYNYINSLLIRELNTVKEILPKLPIPLFNVLNGGAHADNSLSIQEFMIIPFGITKFSEQLRAGAEIDGHLKRILKEKGATTSVGDEGGFAPDLPTDETALDFLIEAIEVSGYKLESEIVLGLDIAASQYWEEDDKVYAIPNLSGEKVLVDKPKKVVDFYISLLNKYPIYMFEDPLAEDDWVGWRHLAKKFDFKNRLLVGDDLTVTNPERVERAAKEKLINGMIIKPNQIGTLSEVFDVIGLCNKYNIQKIISHRSGETMDTFIADLAVGTGSSFIKNGAPQRGERVVKYNRLLEIENELVPNTSSSNLI
ncbi:MAG: phosphopyruvate hydratase [Patescibacteria group bacterium]|nr:phosphopyruvate hydratase [Patescibacteria group bacterium]